VIRRLEFARAQVQHGGMSGIAGAEGFGSFGTDRRSRILCGACRSYFLAPRPTPGSHVICAMCGAEVEVGPRVKRKEIIASSRAYFAVWMDDGRDAASDAMLRVALCIALVAGGAFVVNCLWSLQADYDERRDTAADSVPIFPVPEPR
jgi:hypothetical protein